MDLKTERDYGHANDRTRPSGSRCGEATSTNPCPKMNPDPERERAQATGPFSKTGLTPEDQRFCIALARETILRISKGSPPPEPAATQLSPAVLKPQACFVTLLKDGHLRGCIGQTIATRPLYESVISSAEGAAARDPRFPPVHPDEVAQLHIGISVLTAPVPLMASSPEHLLEQIEPLRHGVLFRLKGVTSTFLPQVWHELPDKVQFMERLARKAGFGPHEWRNADAVISVYEAESFEEPQSGPDFI